MTCDMTMLALAVLVACAFCVNAQNAAPEPEMRAVNGSLEIHVQQGNAVYAVEHSGSGESTRLDLLQLLRRVTPLEERQDKTDWRLNATVDAMTSAVERLRERGDDLGRRTNTSIAALEAELTSTINTKTQTLATAVGEDIHSLRANITATMSQLRASVDSELSDQRSAINDLSGQVTAITDQLVPRMQALEMQLQALQPVLDTFAGCTNIAAYAKVDGTCYPTSGVCPDPVVMEGVTITIATSVQPDVIEYVPGTLVNFACPDGYYLPGDDTATCLRTLEWSRDPPECKQLTVCRPSEYVKTPATSSTDRECEQCPPNTFSSTDNAATCASYSTCGVNKYASVAPSPTNDRGCTPCPSGQVQPSSSYTGNTCYVYRKLPIASCSASSEYSSTYRCSNAFNGVFADGGNAWATSGQGTGSWIRFNFPQNVRVTRMRYQQRSCSCEWYRQLRLDFNDGSSRTLDLPNSQGPINKDFTYTGAATSVKVTGTQVYTTTNNGFNEVEFYGFIV
ncbi:hypothetical protein PTSG_09719 [Salpingoeca rosetta]|uniref:Sushi domain-containing protein n=1 Tax=Salpingoeca rosetta (strain ATCC 50818 / BSB-021) TaxID=946362 RepID=F2UNU8_SALR5|nr:uncharacterized protein PTSG_09719 [Salpingoeca rosetta]EGD79303.1 hypothetical protein PTSG_09719 [Salpingoeca rosetta]|eukprot:XP_004989074.1 hypothetical protein PTSG_09719 [Salpingoeca rosetta]